MKKPFHSHNENDTIETKPSAISNETDWKRVETHSIRTSQT